MKKIFDNPKTSALGAAALFAALAHALAMYATGSVDALQIGNDIVGVLAGFGLINASDAKG